MRVQKLAKMKIQMGAAVYILEDGKQVHSLRERLT